MNICVFGASSNRLDNVYFEQAEALGLAMAKAGHTLVFGGGARKSMWNMPTLWNSSAGI